MPAKKKTGPKRDRRSLNFKFRISPAERERIRDRAQAAGLTPTEFVRGKALGAMPKPSAKKARAEAEHESWVEEPMESSEPKRLPAPNINAGIDSDGSIVKLTPVQADEVSGSLHGAAGESRVPATEDEAAFLKRRTQQLYGQGNTERLARALAEAEWRARG